MRRRPAARRARPRPSAGGRASRARRGEGHAPCGDSRARSTPRARGRARPMRARVTMGSDRESARTPGRPGRPASAGASPRRRGSGMDRASGATGDRGRRGDTRPAAGGERRSRAGGAYTMGGHRGYLGEVLEVRLQGLFWSSEAVPRRPSRRGLHMNTDKPVYVSADGLKKLEAELEELRTHKRREVAERIHNAMEFGDFSENSELEQAKNDQAFLEGRILSLEQMLKKAVVIEQNGHHDLVEIGSKVVVEAEGERNEYVIVGSAEASPGEGRISNESPVGKALIGHRAGETVKLTVPAGAVQMKILGVS